METGPAIYSRVCGLHNVSVNSSGLLHKAPNSCAKSGNAELASMDLQTLKNQQRYSLAASVAPLGEARCCKSEDEGAEICIEDTASRVFWAWLIL